MLYVIGVIIVVLVICEVGVRAIGMKSLFFVTKYPTIRHDPDTGQFEEV